jgi:hypothetical protein
MTQGFDSSRVAQDAAARQARDAQFAAEMAREMSGRAAELGRQRLAGRAKGRRRRHWFFRLIGFLLVLAILAIFAAVVIVVASAHGVHL